MPRGSAGTLFFRGAIAGFRLRRAILEKPPLRPCGGAYLVCAGRGRPQSHWGVVQPVGHHTVNVDGEGSNPSAPATSPKSGLNRYRRTVTVRTRRGKKKRRGIIALRLSGSSANP